MVYSMNQKGDFFIYLIFSIVILLIGAIIFYVYQGQDSFDWFSKDKDLNFSNSFKDNNKLPATNNTQKLDVYKNSYDFKAEIGINTTYDVKDNNISIIGKPTISNILILKNPYLSHFNGAIGETIEGYVNTIYFEDSEIIVKSKVNFDLNDIDKMVIEELKINFENTNISGKIFLENNTLDLDKAYLNFKGFTGNATINPKNNTITFEGKIGYLKIKNKGLTTTLE